MEDDSKQYQKFLGYIKDNITLSNFKTWFSQTEFGGLTEDKLTLIVPSAFIKGQLISRYETLINQAIEIVFQKSLSVEYIIDSSKFTKKPISTEKTEEEDIFQLPQTHQTQAILNPKYNLQNFVVGLTNNLAYAAAQAVVQNPGISYNPLFIYGPSGVGKTHLMQGIGNALLQKNPNTKIIFTSSEKFTNDFVQAIQNKRTGDFRQRYRNCDLLLVDDIQFIAGKDSTQEEFFHTFNELHTRNAQIILTSDRTPNEMQKLESRLSSRFQGGLMVDIQLPDLETRMAILKAKLAERGETLDENVLRMIAESVEANTRELEGKLIQMIQINKLSPLTEQVAQRYLGTPKSMQNNQILDSNKVISGINQYFNINPQDLTGPRRQKELVLPRQIAMYILYEDCKLPFEKIGQLLGGRDHTTVMHGVEKIKQVIQKDLEIQRMVGEIKTQLTT